MRKVFLIGIVVASILIILGAGVIFKGKPSGVPDAVNNKTALAQQGVTPELEDKPSAADIYKLGRTIRSESEQNKLYLYISVDPQNFTRDKMITLARQLNHDFPDEQRLLAIILDDEDMAGKSHGVANQLDLFQAAERGAYSLDRVENKEYIEFSTQRGKPPNEIKVTLSPALYRIGRTIGSENEQDNLIIYVSVDPQNFTRDKMVSVARQLNHDFPDEKRLSVTIFDDEETARKAIGAGAQYELFQEAKRGYYYLNRMENKEYIEFSTQPGKPPNEIKVTLSLKSSAASRKRN